MEQIKTLADIKKSGINLHHTALTRGYVSRKLSNDDCVAIPYSGKFGEGYIVYTPNWDSTRYCYISYYIK